MTELIITEKPSSAQKVAEALADGKPIKNKFKQSSFYELSHKGQDIIVTSAVGHLFGLAEEKKKSWSYPVFEIKWVPSNEILKDAKYVKDYIEAIASLSKKVDSFTIACDYDVEGEVIGLNVVRFVCHQKDANRMKFSTLTKPDLIEAYEQKMKHLDWGQALAGETRHKLDWFYGINLSRALTASVKAAGSFKVMSAGRVQGPALKILVDREREIEAFKPEPFWELYLHGNYSDKNLKGASASKDDSSNAEIEAKHHKDKFTDLKEVQTILKKVEGEKEAKVKDVKRNKRQQAPPYPFDLTTLQSESYNLFHITPKETLALAQNLYLAGVTSYPRTSSQQLDPKLGFKKILTDLTKQPEYDKLCSELLKLKDLKPNNGNKTDPAHPAIYPTGLVPSTLKPNERKLYDLIVKRFMATFAQPAVRETMEVSLDVKEEVFICKGTRTLEENWHIFYKPYVKLEEVTLPDMKIGEVVKIKKIEKVDKETQPPNRYNQSSIIKELEKRNLGTKATRADILDRLFQRNYVEGIKITVTKLGMETIKVLEKYAPLIVDEKLTADFEGEMDLIREGKTKQETVLEKAKKFLIGLLDDFKKKEVQIGKDIIQSVRDTQEKQNYVGICKKCGGNLTIKFGKFGRFIACDKYPACKVTFKLPATGLVKNSEKTCELCNSPKIMVIQKGKRPHEFCINPDCKSKILATPSEIKKSDKKCVNCGKDMVLRRSFYGEFWGCSGYPNCKTIVNIERKDGFVKKTEENKSATSETNSGLSTANTTIKSTSVSKPVSIHKTSSVSKPKAVVKKKVKK
ncbi:DNA topoisomerase I [Candidatus Woesearchaeota archaeon]|nr:DNA topoisomerase I [Candidatus Woesearchaeota archaeon]